MDLCPCYTVNDPNMSQKIETCLYLRSLVCRNDGKDLDPQNFMRGIENILWNESPMVMWFVMYWSMYNPAHGGQKSGSATDLHLWIWQGFFGVKDLSTGQFSGLNSKVWIWFPSCVDYTTPTTRSTARLWDQSYEDKKGSIVLCFQFASLKWFENFTELKITQSSVQLNITLWQWNFKAKKASNNLNEETVNCSWK